MRYGWLFLFFLWMVGCQRARPPISEWTLFMLEHELVDLTHSVDEDMVFWPLEEGEGFTLEPIYQGYTADGIFYLAHRFCMSAHAGTHVDAPVHFYEGRMTVDQIPLERLVAPAVVVDVREKVRNNRDYQVTVDDLLAWEEAHQTLLDGKVVFLLTGHGRFWGDREAYLGTNLRGVEAIGNMHFPGLHPDAAEWLVTTRSIKGVGIDGPSIDFGPSRRFRAHVLLFEYNIPVFENVANLYLLPDEEFLVAALPLKLRRGSGAPVRIVALVKRKRAGS